MTEYQRISGYTERRLQRASQYVSDMWFPANPVLLSKLQTAVQTQYYDSDLDVLIAEIESDYSLFFYCLRELMRLFREEGIEPPAVSSPVELFKCGGLERLKQILSVSERNLSRHSFNGMSTEQKQRLEEALISASATQVLAENSQINPDLGFSAALLRQLGYTLIAWNYPEVYQRCMLLVKDGVSIDLAISKLLGFSPIMLAIKLSQSWGLAHYFLDAFDEDDAEQTETRLHAQAAAPVLSRLCKIGEALARANDPERYPSAKRDWETAKMEIFTRLGAQGLTVIQEAISENCETYTLSAPALFRGGFILDPEVNIAAFEQSQPIRRNPYVERCRIFLKQKLYELYGLIGSKNPAEETVRILTREIIPAAGFSGGAVYSIDPAAQVLVPHLKIGIVRLRDLAPVPADSAHSTNDMVASAWITDEIICKSNAVQEDAVLACFAGFFGYSQRYGVIYLEMPQLIFNGSEDRHLAHFKAICLALTDCLESEA